MVSVAGSHLQLPPHRFGRCFNDIPTVIAALGPHTRAYQRNAPSVPHRHELRGHYGVHRERRCRVHGDVAAIALIAGTAVAARGRAQ
jgi:hypothetical protein